MAVVNDSRIFTLRPITKSGGMKTGNFYKSKAKVDFYQYKLLYAKTNIQIH